MLNARQKKHMDGLVVRLFTQQACNFLQYIIMVIRFFQDRQTTFTCILQSDWRFYATRPKLVTDEMFIKAARATADQVTDNQLKMGMLFPPQSNVLDTEVRTAESVARLVFERNLARVDPAPKDINAWLRAMLYKPEYAASHISRKETLRHDFLFPSDVFCPCIYYMTMKSAQINRYGGSEVIEINQNTPDTEQFFIKETIVQRLKTVAAFLAVAIPIVISIIRLLAGGG